MRGELECLSECNLCFVTVEGLDLFRQEDIIGYSIMLQKTKDRLQKTSDHCVDIGKKTPLERVASFIFESRSRTNSDVELVSTGLRNLSNIEIGDYLALRPEAVSRTFSALEKMNLIKKSAWIGIAISDHPKLRQLANGGHPRGQGAM